jgi:HEAT repeat protein
MTIAKYLLVLALCVVVLTACSDPTTPKGTFILGDTVATPLPKDVATLIPLIASSDIRLQLMAMQTLESFGANGAPAIPSLLIALESDEAAVQLAAIRCLGIIGPPAQPSIPNLLSLLANTNEGSIQDPIILTLAKIDDSSVVPNLAPMLYSSREPIRFDAAHALQTLAGKDFITLYERFSPQTDDEPLVDAARTWWEQDGKYQEWGRR